MASGDRSKSTVILAAEAEARITGKQFCPGCRFQRRVEDMRHPKGKRPRCVFCIEKAKARREAAK